MALTDAWLKANLNKVRVKKLIKSDRDGLNIRVSPKGKMTYNLWYDAYCIYNKKGHDEIKRSFEIHVFPKLGKLPADTETRDLLFFDVKSSILGATGRKKAEI